MLKPAHENEGAHKKRTREGGEGSGLGGSPGLKKESKKANTKDETEGGNVENREGIRRPRKPPRGRGCLSRPFVSRLSNRKKKTSKGSWGNRWKGTVERVPSTQ